MITLGKINRPIRFFGLSTYQFCGYVLAIILSLLVSIFLSVHPLIIAAVLIGLIYFSKSMFKTLMKEHKAGNPDYLAGLSVKRITPNKIVDKHHVFKHILTEKQ